jgi:hypothetical protein
MAFTYQKINIFELGAIFRPFLDRFTRSHLHAVKVIFENGSFYGQILTDFQNSCA